MTLISPQVGVLGLALLMVFAAFMWAMDKDEWGD